MALFLSLSLQKLDPQIFLGWWFQGYGLVVLQGNNCLYSFDFVYLNKYVYILPTAKSSGKWQYLSTHCCYFPLDSSTFYLCGKEIFMTPSSNISCIRLLGVYGSLWDLYLFIFSFFLSFYFYVTWCKYVS